MAFEIITKEDLQVFRAQLINDIRKLLSETPAPKTKEQVEGYKTNDVRRILGCCYNTLYTLRVSKRIRAKKVLGRWYYNKEDVKKLVEDGFK